MYQNVLMAHVLCSGAHGSQQNCRGDPVAFWGLGVPKQGSTPATPLHVHTFGTFLSKQNQRNNHGSLKMEAKSQKSKRPFAFIEEVVCFIKGSFSNLLETLFSCVQGKRRGTK